MALFPPPPSQRRWTSQLPRFFASLRWQFLLRYALFAFLISLALSGVLLFRRPEALFGKTENYYDNLWDKVAPPAAKPTLIPSGGAPTPPEPRHPIEELIADAHTTQDTLLAQRSKDVPSAAAQYRKRRGRHPPPGFDAWMQFAVDNDAIIVESFFDRIYHDLTPFWALDPNTTATRAASWHHVVRVRDGKVYPTGDTQGRVAWLQLWSSLVNESRAFLPDVDMPINYMDESRLLVPWEDVDKYVKKEHTMRSLVPKDKVVRKYTGLAHVDARRNMTEPYDPEWHRGSYWDLTRAACAPDSASRDVATPESYEQYPTIPESYDPDFAHRGYVRNFTASMDACSQPHLREMHGTFVEPLTMSTSKELIPLFGGSKLPGNNEILIPGAMYLTDDPFYSGGVEHGPPWKDKIDGVVWRGVGSGGRNKKENWSHFQRHRLIEMLNATTVAGMEETNTRAPTFELAPLAKYDFSRRRTGTIGTWLENFSNAGFVNLLCFPAEVNCSYVRPYLSEIEGMPMLEQYKYKFMPDVDGNSFSARYRGFLLSTSLPIKATVYAEWHDDRLMPWQHFVPMDNTFQELYGILDYFTRDEKGDDSARFIAETGRKWATQVLRREDMLLYVWRLLLEFARVCDEKRELLGYVDDLDDKAGYDENGSV